MKLTPRINYRIRYRDILTSLFNSSNNLLVENTFKKYFHKSSIFFLDSARSGIYIALKSLNISKKLRVGVMTYNCHTVFNAICQANCIPVFIDVNSDFSISTESLKKENLDVLIVSHLFGLVNDIELIKGIIPGVIIIEDCAHSFLSKDKNGYNSGLIGDFAVYSFNFGKFPAIGSGGLLLANNNKYVNKISEEINLLKKPTFVKDVLSAFKKCVLVTIHKPLLYGILYQLKTKASSKNVNYNHQASIISDADCYMLKLIMLKMDMNFEKQLANTSTIKGKNFEQCDLRNNGFMIPLLINEKEKHIKLAYSKGIEIGSHFFNSILWAEQFGYIRGSCPNSEEIAKKIITIPCYYTLTDSEVVKISELYSELNLNS